MSSLVFEGLNSRQMVHFMTFCSICFFIPGQNRMSQALCLHLSLPIWPVCIRDNISTRSNVGMMTFSPLNKMLFILIVPNVLWGHLLLPSGHPSLIVFFSSRNCVSFSVSVMWLTVTSHKNIMTLNVLMEAFASKQNSYFSTHNCTSNVDGTLARKPVLFLWKLKCDSSCVWSNLNMCKDLLLLWL